MSYDEFFYKFVAADSPTDILILTTLMGHMQSYLPLGVTINCPCTHDVLTIFSLK